MLQHYQNLAMPELASLIKEEAITYSVLMKILRDECTDIFTDRKSAVVCYSCQPWPVWVWCKDLSMAGEIGECLKTHFPLEQGYDIIMRYDMLEQLRREDDYFHRAKQGRGLLSYRLDSIRNISGSCEGYMDLVRQEELPGLGPVWKAMHIEMEGRHLTSERSMETMSRMVGKKSLFAWRLQDGTIAALTGRGDQPPYSKITSVYTLPEFRRKGFALSLVHGVTKMILDDGLIPILYTDAGYEASNACYRKIGYELVGRLASICG